MTFSKACEHIANYSSGHETRLPLIGEDRLCYPQNHIESDNRLCWILGRLDEVYGDNAVYVHLSRDKQKVAESYARRTGFGIMKAYREGILLGGVPSQSTMEVALDYIETVEANIKLFLYNKSRTLKFSLESAKQDFKTFWDFIGAEGDYEAAVKEWDIPHNRSEL
ncbi:MAG: guanine nucleotide-binding protein subunit gamma [Gammaproteobacteria bacterium]|nr:guanine nucleotide-binding protein subunit gamma [Gammaproteobacteria bacterium]MDH5800012.1 guanine nucleotide-binding protein subunit gamma [Gammaproteobacteria bacterium]